jgi:hypothetical protein
MVEVGGKKVRGRQYPWGVVEVENPEHCDFVKLRSAVVLYTVPSVHIFANGRNMADNSLLRRAVFRIRDVYPGSRIRIFSIPDPGSASKKLKFFNPIIVSKLSEI